MVMNIYNLLEPGSLVFDVGANRGQKADSFLLRGHSVCCFEPLEDLAGLMKEKYENKKKAQVFNIAVGGGKPTFFHRCVADKLSTCSSDWMHKGRFAGKYSWGLGVEVETQTLDSLIDFCGTPEYIKIDVEGYELEVIKGLTKKVRFISFEYTKEFFDITIECINQLQKIGFTKFNFTVGEFEQFIFPSWKTKEVLIPFIEGMCDALIFGDIYAT